MPPPANISDIASPHGAPGAAAEGMNRANRPGRGGARRAHLRRRPSSPVWPSPPSTPVLSRAAHRRRRPLAVLPQAARASSRGRVRLRRPRRSSRQHLSPQPLPATAPPPPLHPRRRPARRAARSGELPCAGTCETSGSMSGWIDRSIPCFFFLFLPARAAQQSVQSSPAQRAAAQLAQSAQPSANRPVLFFLPSEQQIAIRRMAGSFDP